MAEEVVETVDGSVAVTKGSQSLIAMKVWIWGWFASNTLGPVRYFFCFYETQYNTGAHIHAYTLIPMNARMHTLSL